MLPGVVIDNVPFCRVDNPEVEFQQYCLLAFTVNGEANAKL
jgi:hypothetical protein